MRIELTALAWKARVLPLYDTRINLLKLLMSNLLLKQYYSKLLICGQPDPGCHMLISVYSTRSLSILEVHSSTLKLLVIKVLLPFNKSRYCKY